MIIDEKIYLDHHGVRGMKWGVRRARSPGSKAPKKPRTAAEKKVLRNKVIGGALLVAGGALFAKMIVDQHATMKMRAAANIYNPRTNVKIAQQINDLISMNTGVRTVTLAKSLGR